MVDTYYHSGGGGRKITKSEGSLVYTEFQGRECYIETLCKEEKEKRRKGRRERGTEEESSKRGNGSISECIIRDESIILVVKILLILKSNY